MNEQSFIKVEGGWTSRFCQPISFLLLSNYDVHEVPGETGDSAVTGRWSLLVARRSWPFAGVRLTFIFCSFRNTTNLPSVFREGDHERYWVDWPSPLKAGSSCFWTLPSSALKEPFRSRENGTGKVIQGRSTFIDSFGSHAYHFVRPHINSSLISLFHACNLERSAPWNNAFVFSPRGFE